MEMREGGKGSGREREGRRGEGREEGECYSNNSLVRHVNECK